jgi:hypothetical protein
MRCSEPGHPAGSSVLLCRAMRKALLLSTVILFSGCAARSLERQFVGTWRMRDSNYLLRIYPDGRVAQWPSPPYGHTAWTSINGNTLNFGYTPPLPNPQLTRRGPLLVMHGTHGAVKESIFDKVRNDLVPPKQP